MNIIIMTKVPVKQGVQKLKKPMPFPESCEIDLAEYNNQIKMQYAN